MRILVTGACGYIGRNLVAALSRTDGVERLIGLDLHAPPEPVARLEFVKRDLRTPLHDIIQRDSVTTVVHLAYVVAPIRDTALMEDINEQGTRAVLEACRRGRVRHLIYTSSMAAYGLHRDNDTPLTEASPLRGNEDFTYARTKKRIEAMVARFAGDNPDVAVTVVRPSFIVGPGCTDPLATHLQKKIVLLPRRTRPFQFVHRTDVTNILMHFIRTRQRGTYNVGAEGTITFKTMVRTLGNIRIGLSWPGIYLFNELAWRLHLGFVTEVPSSALRFLVHPCVMSAEKLVRETGYCFLYDTRAAFEDYVCWVKNQSRTSASRREPRVTIRRALAQLRAGDAGPA